MKKIFLSLTLLCAFVMVSCGNAEMDKITQAVIDATEATASAETADEVAAIALGLQAEMAKIEAEAGEKFVIGKSVELVLAKYQEIATAKLAEFGLSIEE